MVKKEVRVLGIDDGPFDKFRDKQAFIIGAFYRGGSFLDGVLSAMVAVDCSDAPSKISAMVIKSKFRPQLQAILLDGIAVAGFNLIDIRQLASKTRIPVIVTMRRMPRIAKMRPALAKLGKSDLLLKKAGIIRSIGKMHYQCAGIIPEKAEAILKVTASHSEIPEPLRVAHIIASGVAFGESKGRA